MSNRYYQKFFIQCGKCSAIQRKSQGYSPIANPMLFKSDEHCGNYHAERYRARGYAGLRMTCLCSKCQTMHSQWTVLDAQQFLDAKLAMTPEQRTALLWESGK